MSSRGSLPANSEVPTLTCRREAPSRRTASYITRSSIMLCREDCRRQRREAPSRRKACHWHITRCREVHRRPTRTPLFSLRCSSRGSPPADSEAPTPESPRLTLHMLVIERIPADHDPMLAPIDYFCFILIISHGSSLGTLSTPANCCAPPRSFRLTTPDYNLLYAPYLIL